MYEVCSIHFHSDIRQAPTLPSSCSAYSALPYIGRWGVNRPEGALVETHSRRPCLYPIWSNLLLVPWNCLSRSSGPGLPGIPLGKRSSGTSSSKRERSCTKTSSCIFTWSFSTYISAMFLAFSEPVKLIQSAWPGYGWKNYKQGKKEAGVKCFYEVSGREDFAWWFVQKDIKISNIDCSW